MKNVDEEKIILSFGIHQGKDIEDVPDRYLLWMWENWKGARVGKLWDYLRENIDAIKKNAKS